MIKIKESNGKNRTRVWKPNEKDYLYFSFLHRQIHTRSCCMQEREKREREIAERERQFLVFWMARFVMTTNRVGFHTSPF